MYCKPISSRLSRGRSTPEIRATCRLLALPLFVPRVRADDEHAAATPDHPALVAHLLDRRPNLHPRVPPYLYRYVILPLDRSYGDNSTRTRSPGRIRM